MRQVSNFRLCAAHDFVESCEKKYFRVEVPTIYKISSELVHISFSFPGESNPSPLLGESIPAVDILVRDEYIVTTFDQ